jgi:hypothetical protein
MNFCSCMLRPEAQSGCVDPDPVKAVKTSTVSTAGAATNPIS